MKIGLGPLLAAAWIVFTLAVVVVFGAGIGAPLLGHRTLFLLPSAVLALGVPRLARSVRRQAGPSPSRQVVGHVLAGLAFVVAELVMLAALGVFGDHTAVSLLVSRLALRGLAAWLFMAGVVHAVDFLRAQRDEQARAAELAAELARASLDAACWRLQPDLLLPALARLDAALDGDPELAADRIARLGDLLRLLLREGGEDATVAEELAVLAAAADVTLGDGALRIEAEDGCGGRTVPRLLLVGLASPALRAGARRLDVRVAEEEGRLTLVLRSEPAGPLDQGTAVARLTARWPGRITAEERTDAAGDEVEMAMPAEVAA